MQFFKHFLIMTLITFASLTFTSCGGTSSDQDGIDPFSEGDILEVVQGDWYSSSCIQNFKNQSSSLEKMEFKFRAPFSWENDFFEEDSLEFTGSLKITNIEYDNAYCLGSGSRDQSLIESNISVNNISVVKNSIETNSFKAFYVQDKERDFNTKRDVGSGVLIEIKRQNGEFIITPLNSFTYQGKNYVLKDLGETTHFTFSKDQKPIQNFNFNDVTSSNLKSFLKSSKNCNQYYVIDHTFQDSKGFYNGTLVVMQPDNSGLKVLINTRESNFTSSFQTTKLEWTYDKENIYTEKGFVISSDSSDIRVQNSDLKINEIITPTDQSLSPIEDFLTERGLSSEAFQSCN